MAWLTQNRNTKTVLLNWGNYYIYTKVDHEQGSAFFSTDWVRSHDQITCQQRDFCPIISSSTTIFCNHANMTEGKCSQGKCGKDRTCKGRVEGHAREGERAWKGTIGVHSTPAIFFISFTLLLTFFHPGTSTSFLPLAEHGKCAI